MDEIFLKPYDPGSSERQAYKKWEDSGFFNPDNLPKRHKKPFTIVMPPPNANGHLHAGHALFITLEDIMARYKRLQGYKTLFIPGADHAGFETQIVYEKKLEKEGRSRFKMEREDLYKEILDFTLENKKYMEEEVRHMGASCDWSREKFTLDEDVIEYVHNTFYKLHKDGYIYRDKKPVNWCTKHQTSLSEVETESKDVDDKLYYIKYGPITVATVRPETIFGDVAIGVNPKDERYSEYIGKEIEVQTPIGKMNLKVVGDDYVESDFGTGALKITPAHDKNDYEFAKRHNLEMVEIIDRYGKLNEKTGKYAGMKIKVAREEVVKDLEEMGLIEKIEEYSHAVPTCYKCNTAIEPLLMPQWFVKMDDFAKSALEASRAGDLNFIPERYQRVFDYWMSNPIDWNISRQIVWGISIPAKICENCPFGTINTDKSTKCPKCSHKLTDDTDTFDTWFSSGQWPLITLGHPNGVDFKEFYPTDVMETGYDLIFKWVPRMVIFGLYLAKDVPFRDVYLHGLVNDAKGKKMSKSKGNVINPMEISEKFGTDAFRISLIIGNTPGNDLSLQENKINGYKHFANKIWNATRYVLENTKNFKNTDISYNKTDEKIMSEFRKMIEDVTKHMEGYRFHLAAEMIYHYFWHNFADIIIEESKNILKTDNADADSRKKLLLEILDNSLIVLHPFMPFITETIWSHLQKDTMLMIEEWPK